jgi:hypothetical protein
LNAGKKSLTKGSVHSGTTRSITFEAWMKEEKFKAQVIMLFEQYLKVAFREHRNVYADNFTTHSPLHSKQLSCKKCDGVHARSILGG